MSDNFDFTKIYNIEFKKAKFILPLNYLKDILKGMTKLFFRENILSQMKNSPISLYHRLFGGESRRHIYDVLVLIADLVNFYYYVTNVVLNLSDGDRNTMSEQHALNY